MKLIKDFKYRIRHSGAKSATYQIEESILNWFNHNRLLRIDITIKSAIAYTTTLCRSLKINNYAQL